MSSSNDSKTPAPWQVLESEYLWRRPWLTMRRDRVRVPTGAIIDEYYVWEYPPWVNVVAVTTDHRLVMVRQYRHGLAAVHYELPAGVVDPTDTGMQLAARRELEEETGFTGGAWSLLLTSSPNPSTHNNLTYSFLAQGVERTTTPQPETTEDLQLCLVPLSELSGLIDAGQIIQALHLAPLLKYLLA